MGKDFLDIKQHSSRESNGKVYIKTYVKKRVPAELFFDYWIKTLPTYL